jgi:hypothetical protein
MHTIFRIAAALALTGASLPALGASATATRSWQFKPAANAGLTVRNLIGDARHPCDRQHRHRCGQPGRG